MALVVDASVLVKLLCEEPGTAQARDVFIREPILIAPDIALAEVFMALWKKNRRGEYRRDQLDLVPPLLCEILARTVPTADLLSRAAVLAVQHDHPIYDCLYVALAERHRIPLATADIRMLAVASQAAVTTQSVVP